MTPCDTLPVNAAALLKKHGLRPRKSLGQNFLQDPAALEKIIHAAEISPQDTVLEIGAGAGTLTRFLAAKARRVVAVEIDSALLPLLEESLRGCENVTLVEGDMLRLAPETLISDEPYLVVANIPYYITSALIRHLLESPRRPRRILLTIQKEVAERICAEKKHSLLSLSVWIYGKPRIAARIPAGAFYPRPEVDSAVLRVDLYPIPRIEPVLMDAFFRLAKAGFSQKRKTLRNALSAGMRISPAEAESLLREAGLAPSRRAETLSVEEWERLTRKWSARVE
jgi:16S rRNA (adenine1518-N6/adenine1519-N6)-dimethyltransferase